MDCKWDRKRGTERTRVELQQWAKELSLKGKYYDTLGVRYIVSEFKRIEDEVRTHDAERAVVG